MWMSYCWNCLIYKNIKTMKIPDQDWFVPRYRSLAIATPLCFMCKHSPSLYLCTPSFLLLTCYHLWTFLHTFPCRIAAVWMSWVCCFLYILLGKPWQEYIQGKWCTCCLMDMWRGLASPQWLSFCWAPEIAHCSRYLKGKGLEGKE